MLPTAGLKPDLLRPPSGEKSVVIDTDAVTEIVSMEFMTSLQGGLDEQKPSLFELLSEQQLAALIPPSLRYLLAVATHRRPRYLLRILNSFDELYALLSLLVERHYLKVYGGGFTENFYGLKRERVLRIKEGSARRAQLGAPSELRETLKLRSSDVWKNLAVMVALPYLKRKLDESYDIHAASINMLGPAYRDRDRYPHSGTVKQKIMWTYKWFLRNIYPSINAAYYFSLLAFNLAYLFDSSKHHSPFLWLINTRLRRLNAADSQAIALATQPPPQPPPPPGARPGQTTSILHPRTITHTLYPRLLSTLKILLPTSIFALKFLEWWHASDFARQLSRKANEGLDLPPPITSDGLLRRPASRSNEKKEKEKRAPISTTSGLPILTVPVPASAASSCPICLTAPIQTPTAAQTGFVYCYACIHTWVEGTHARQDAFMEGSGEGEEGEAWGEEVGGSREGKWESGAGRDAVTGRRLLGGTGGLRRVVV